MHKIFWVVTIVAFGVDGLLLASANLLAGGSGKTSRIWLAAALVALYTGMCVYMLPLSKYWRRLIALLLTAVIAFGTRKESMIPILAYLFMNLAATFLAKAIGDGHGAVASVIVAALCFLRGNIFGKTVCASLKYGTEELHIRVLKDTGNCLKDPLTGDHVLVLGAEAARKLVGLEMEQLQDPISTVEKGVVRGLRLIPYQSISGKGLLVALRIPDVQIGRTRRSRLVAFAPCVLDDCNGFHGLTGGYA